MRSSAESLSVMQYLRDGLQALMLGCVLTSAQAQDLPWQVAGEQGVMRYVIVPMASARDITAYNRQIALLCEPDTTCFLNFYTNSTHAAVAMPLPDAISAESTAIFRKSMKRASETFEWSCRMQLVEGSCF